MEGWWGFAGVILGAVIAGIVSIGGEALRAQHETILDASKREDNRRIESDRIQRDNLLELQTRLVDWARAEHQAMAFDSSAFRQTGHLTLLPDALSEAVFEANRQLGYRVERVKDDALRDSLKALTARAAEIHAARAVFHESVTQGGLEGEEAELVQAVSRVHTLLGDTLRRYL